MLTPVQRLKLELMTNGMAVSAAAREELSGREERPLTLADYATTSGISLELEGGIWVNAPIQEHNPNFVEDPLHVLDYRDGRYIVRSSALRVPAQPVPVPEYHDKTNPWGEPYTSFAITHTDRVRISPIEGCGIVCKFCDLPYEFRYHKKHTQGLVESIGRALRDPRVPAQHVLISGGAPKPEDYGYGNEVYEAVVSAFPGLDVDIMMVPMPKLLDIARLYAIGIHGLSINLEMYNEELAQRIMPPKARLTRRHFLDFIARAVEIFGQGRVRSLLLVGLEPLEDTLHGIEALAERGCEPVLSPFRPDPATPLRQLKPPSVEVLVEAYERSRDIVERLGVKLGPRCIPCHHNTLTFPDDSGWYYCSSSGRLVQSLPVAGPASGVHEASPTRS